MKFHTLQNDKQTWRKEPILKSQTLTFKPERRLSIRWSYGGLNCLKTFRPQGDQQSQTWYSHIREKQQIFMFEKLEPEIPVSEVSVLHVHRLCWHTLSLSLCLQTTSSQSSAIPPGWPDSRSRSPAITTTTFLSPMGRRPLIVSSCPGTAWTPRPSPPSVKHRDLCLLSFQSRRKIIELRESHSS